MKTIKATMISAENQCRKEVGPAIVPVKREKKEKLVSVKVDRWADIEVPSSSWPHGDWMSASYCTMELLPLDLSMRRGEEKRYLRSHALQILKQ